MTPRVQEIISRLYSERRLTALREYSGELTNEEWDFLEVTFHFAHPDAA